MCRVYSSFTLEAIVATAFGRQINVQRGESDDFATAMDTAMKGFASGQLENVVLFYSMLRVIYCIAEKFGGELNLVIWWYAFQQPN